MKTPTIINEKIDLNLSEEVMRFFAKVGLVTGVSIGTWALVSLFAGLISNGPLSMVRGYITAITGY